MKAAPDFEPVRIVEVEIGEPLCGVSVLDEETGRRYRRARALVRLHTRPLGIVEFELGEAGLSAAEYARLIWHTLSREITAHLRQDGLPRATGLDAAGLPSVGKPWCLQARERLLGDAPFMSVLVSTRDRPKRMAACLRSLLALDYPRYEIIVVDNAPSTSATADLIQQNCGHLPQVRYLREDRPGLSWGRNRGLAEAKGEIVAYTDDDVMVDVHWLAGILEGFRVTENVACVTGLILPVELETLAEAQVEHYGGYNKGFNRRIFDLGENRPRSLIYPFAAGTFGAGANMAFKTSALRAMGGFDTALGTGTPTHGGEDLAAFFQVITGGYRLVYEPASLIYHLHRQDNAEFRRRMGANGIGLAAYLTKCMFDDPKRVFEIAVKAPSGLSHLSSSRWTKQSGNQASYPRELVYLEVKGILYGPIAYIRSCWRARRIRRRFGPLEVEAQTRW
jgi:GT2 family glycosyltransferase